MIVTDRRSPQQALADTLHGQILGPTTIAVASHLIVAHPSGIVRADGVRVGRWDDGTAALAARCRAVIDLGPAPGPVAVAAGGAS